MLLYILPWFQATHHASLRFCPPATCTLTLKLTYLDVSHSCNIQARLKITLWESPNSNSGTCSNDSLEHMHAGHWTPHSTCSCDTVFGIFMDLKYTKARIFRCHIIRSQRLHTRLAALLALPSRLKLTVSQEASDRTQQRTCQLIPQSMSSSSA